MGKAITAMIFIWIMISIAGGVTSGQAIVASTTLTANITAAEVANIPVTSTAGFADSGFIVIEGELITYPHKTANAFTSTGGQNIGRGESGGTDASAHAATVPVRTREGGMLNDSLQYQIATFTDSSGILGMISIPLKLLRLLLSFAILPISFFGTDLEIIGFIWIAVILGIITAIGISVVGGRRI